MSLSCLRTLARRGPLSVGLPVLGAVLAAEMAITAAVLALTDAPPMPLTLLVILAPLAVAPPVAWLIARLACELERSEQRQRALSLSDPVTGLHNSRFLLDIGAQQVHQARRYSHPLTAVLIRLDQLDCRRHDDRVHRADSVLRSAAARLRILVRECDIFCRLDDDTFVLLLPETDTEAATLMVDRLHESLAAAPAGSGTEAVALSARFGVATMTRPDLDHLLSRARAALDNARGAGGISAAPPRPMADVLPDMVDS